MRLTLDSRFKVASDVRSRRFHDELVILDLARGEYFALDEVGAVVWEAFARGEALGTVATSLAALYEADREQIDADVCALVDELTQRHLLVPVD